jgi:FKBP-type peptidyl-prolyl cis-trans isomerase
VTAETTPAPTTDAQRQAYASGVTVWREIENSVAAQRALGITLDTSQVLAGLQDAATHRPLRLSPEETERVMADLNSDYLRRMNEVRLRQVEAGKAYRVSFSKQKGAYSDAGAWYRIEDKGTGRRLKTSDTVLLEVTGTLPDGTVFDASGQHGQTRKVRVGSLLPPVSIGLQRVGVGGHLTVVVPPAKGYGDAGLPPSVPGGATLIFDIRVKDRTAG